MARLLKFYVCTCNFLVLVVCGKHYSLDWTWILDWTGLWTGLMDYGSILH